MSRCTQAEPRAITRRSFSSFFSLEQTFTCGKTLFFCCFFFGKNIISKKYHFFLYSTFFSGRHERADCCALLTLQYTCLEPLWIGIVIVLPYSGEAHKVYVAAIYPLYHKRDSPTTLLSSALALENLKYSVRLTLSNKSILIYKYGDIR